MKYPNILWAISLVGNRYKFAAMIGRSESWLSRRLLGRVPFTSDERQTVAQALGYPAEWLFQEPQPPASAITRNLEQTFERGRDARSKRVP